MNTNEFIWNWQNFWFTLHAFCIAHSMQQNRTSLPTLMITFCPLRIKIHFMLKHFYCSSYCKFPDYNFESALCSCNSLLCSRRATWRTTPVEYYESSPEWRTTSGTGNTFRKPKEQMSSQDVHICIPAAIRASSPVCLGLYSVQLSHASDFNTGMDHNT